MVEALNVRRALVGLAMGVCLCLLSSLFLYPRYSMVVDGIELEISQIEKFKSTVEELKKTGNKVKENSIIEADKRIMEKRDLLKDLRLNFWLTFVGIIAVSELLAFGVLGRLTRFNTKKRVGLDSLSKKTR